MHRAKGLEFDTVVLLGLAREPRSDDERRSGSLERARADGGDDLSCAAPTRRRGGRLTAFRATRSASATRAERARLLYVATTRARERLHLVWQLPRACGRAAARIGTLLQHIWPRWRRSSAAAARRARRSTTVARRRAWLPVLRRLAAPPADRRGGAGLAAPFDAAFAAARRRGPSSQWAGQAAVHVGTVVHRYLQHIAEQAASSLERRRARRAHGRHSTRELRAARRRRRRTRAARRARGDGRCAHRSRTTRPLGARPARGRALRAAGHAARRRRARAHSPRPHVRRRRRALDRRLQDGPARRRRLERFLDSEVERYRPAARSLRAAVAAIDSRPMQLALYFPLLGELRAWPPALQRPVQLEPPAPFGVGLRVMMLRPWTSSRAHRRAA